MADPRSVRSLTFEQYKILRNTVRVIRGSGVPLNAKQQFDLEKFERLVRAYELQVTFRSVDGRGPADGSADARRRG